MNWITHLKHLQFILKKLDSSTIPNKETLIRYFWDILRPSIRAQLYRFGCQLDNCKNIIKKAIDVKPKSTHWRLAIIKYMSSWCATRYQPLKTNDFDNNIETKKLHLSSPVK